jgi:hypothetical protein
VIQKTSLLVLFFLGIEFVHSQTLILSTAKYDFLGTDVYGQIYMVNDAELMKHDAQGNFKQKYVNNRLGNIGAIDATNPLKILVFYRESNALVFLDHNLIEITGGLDIYEMAGFEASLACTSSDGGFWLWNPVQQTVNHFTDQRVSDRQTQCLSDWFTGNTVTEILECEQKLFVVASHKILLFDYFGTYLNSLALEQVKNLSITNQTLVWLSGNKLLTYHWQSHQTGEMPLPEGKSPKQAFLVGNKMILGLESSIEIYDLK